MSLQPSSDWLASSPFPHAAIRPACLGTASCVIAYMMRLPTSAVVEPRHAGEVRLVLVGDTHGLLAHVPVPAGDVLLLHGDVFFQVSLCRYFPSGDSGYRGI
jgi:hypothetical protein